MLGVFAVLVIIFRKIITSGCNPILGFVIGFDFEVLKSGFLVLRSESYRGLLETMCSFISFERGAFLFWLDARHFVEFVYDFVIFNFIKTYTNFLESLSIFFNF